MTYQVTTAGADERLVNRAICRHLGIVSDDSEAALYQHDKTFARWERGGLCFFTRASANRFAGELRTTLLWAGAKDAGVVVRRVEQQIYF